MGYTTDTTPEAEDAQLAAARKLSPAERFWQTCVLSSQVRQMAFDAIRRRFPEMTDGEVKLKFIELTYGKSLAEAVRGQQPEGAA